MEKVLARQEEKPHVLNQAQLSIRIYDEFVEDEDDNWFWKAIFRKCILILEILRKVYGKLIFSVVVA